MATIAEYLSAKEKALTPAASAGEEENTVASRLGDIGAIAGRTLTGIGDTAIGLGDIATGGKLGEVLESTTGYTPGRAGDIITEELASADFKAGEQAVTEAEGFGDTALSYLKNPGTALAHAVESLPYMLPAAKAAQVAKIAAGGGRLGSVAATTAASGVEGGVTAAQTFNELREEELGARYAGTGLAGLGGAAAGIVGGQVGKKIGLGDVDAMMGARGPAAGSILKGMVQEGVLEEAPQSAIEQMSQNYAQDKPLMEGVPKAVASGLIIGSGVGGAARAAQIAVEPPLSPAEKGKRSLRDSVAAGLKIKQERQQAGVYTKEETDKLVKANKAVQKASRQADKMELQARDLEAAKDKEGKADEGKRKKAAQLMKEATQIRQDAIKDGESATGLISDVRDIQDTRGRIEREGDVDALSRVEDDFIPSTDQPDILDETLPSQAIQQGAERRQNTATNAILNQPDVETSPEGIGIVGERTAEIANNEAKEKGIAKLRGGQADVVRVPETQETSGTDEEGQDVPEATVDGGTETEGSTEESIIDRESGRAAPPAWFIGESVTINGTKMPLEGADKYSEFALRNGPTIVKFDGDQFQRVDEAPEEGEYAVFWEDGGITVHGETAPKKEEIVPQEESSPEGIIDQRNKDPLSVDISGTELSELEKQTIEAVPPSLKSIVQQLNEGNLNEIQKEMIARDLEDAVSESHLLTKSGDDFKSVAALKRAIKKTGKDYDIQGNKEDGFYGVLKNDPVKVVKERFERIKVNETKKTLEEKSNADIQKEIVSSPDENVKSGLEKELRNRRGTNRYSDGVVGFAASPPLRAEPEDNVVVTAAKAKVKELKKRKRFAKMRQAVMQNNSEIEDIIYTNSLDNLPQWAREQYEKSDKDNAGLDNVKGAYIRNDEGKVLVFVNSSQFKSADAIELTMLHELVGHFGMNKLLGKDGYTRLLDRVVKTNKHMVKEAYALRKRWNNINLTPNGYNYKLNIDGKDVLVSQKGMRSLVDELIAETAKDYADPIKRAKMKEAQRNYFERILSWIRHSLRKMFPTVTNDDIAALLATSYDLVMDGVSIDGVPKPVDGEATSRMFNEKDLNAVDNTDFLLDEKLVEKYPLSANDLDKIGTSFNRVLKVEGEDVIVSAINDTFSDGEAYSEIAFGKLKDWEKAQESSKSDKFDPDENANWKSPVKAFNRIFSVIKEAVIDHASHSRVPLVIAGSTPSRYRIYKRVLDKLEIPYTEDTSQPGEPFLHIDPKDISGVDPTEGLELIALETAAVDEASTGGGARQTSNQSDIVKDMQRSKMDKWRSAIDKGFEWISSQRGTAWLQPLGHLPGISVYNKTQQIPRGEIQKFDKQADAFHKVMNKKYKSLTGRYEKLNKNQKDEVFRFFTEKGAVLNENILPAEVVAEANKAKESIMDLQTRLAATDIFSSGSKGENLQKQILESRGSYLPVIYLNGLTEKTRYKGSGKRASMMDYLKKKRELNDLELEVKGQTRDPGIIVADALGTLGRDVPLFEMMGNMKEANAQNNEFDWFHSPTSTFNIRGKRFKYGRLLEEIEYVEQILKADPEALSLRQTPEGTQLNKDYLDELKEGKRGLEKEMFQGVKQQMIAEKFQDMPDSPEKNDLIEKEFQALSDEMAEEFLKGKYVKTSYKDRWLGPLRGDYIHKEIYNDLIDTTKELDTHNLNAVAKLMVPGGTLEKITGAWKTSKVGLNPASWVRNIIGSGMLLDINTPTNSGALTKMISQEINALFGKGNTEWKKLAEQYGLFATTFSANEMYQVEKQFRQQYRKDLAKDEGKDTLPVRGLWMLNDVGRAFGELAGNVHGLSEGLFKTVAMRDFVQRWEKTNGKLSSLPTDTAESRASSEKIKKDLYAEAAQYANDTIFDYSSVPSWLRSFRRTPLGSPFFTFMYKAFPATIKGTLKHPQKMLKYYTAPYLISQAIMAMGAGMDEDEYKEVNKSLPNYMAEKSSLFIFPLKDDNGKISYVDMSYIFPWAQFVDMGTRLKNGVRDGNFTSAAADLFFRDMGILSGPVPNMVTAIQSNVDPFTQREIVSGEATAKEQFQQRFTYLWNMATPPFISSHGIMARMAKYGLGQNLSKLGTEKETFGQHLSSGFGLTAGKFDPREGRMQNVKNFAYEQKRLKSFYRKKILDPNTSVTAKAGYIQDMQSQLKKLQKRRTDYLRSGF